MAFATGPGPDAGERRLDSMRGGSRPGRSRRSRSRAPAPTRPRTPSRPAFFKPVEKGVHGHVPHRRQYIPTGGMLENTGEIHRRQGSRARRTYLQVVAVAQGSHIRPDRRRARAPPRRGRGRVQPHRRVQRRRLRDRDDAARPRADRPLRTSPTLTRALLNDQGDFMAYAISFAVLGAILARRITASSPRSSASTAA